VDGVKGKKEREGERMAGLGMGFDEGNGLWSWRKGRKGAVSSHS